MAHDTLFQPPVEHWQRLSPKFLTVKLIGCAIGWGVFFAAAIVGIWLATMGTGVTWLRWAVIAVAVVVLAWRLIRLPRWVRNWGYAERDEDVYVTQGLLFRSLTCVPYGRMQVVEVSAGPIERALGLASVEMKTASSSGSVSIPGLDRAAAEALRDRFIDRGQHLRAGI